MKRPGLDATEKISAMSLAGLMGDTISNLNSLPKVVCEKCDRRFKTPSGLSVHIREYHGGQE